MTILDEGSTELEKSLSGIEGWSSERVAMFVSLFRDATSFEEAVAAAELAERLAP